MINPYHGLPPFEYIKPGSLEEASSFLYHHHPEASPMLGGTDIFVQLRNRVSYKKYLVDLKSLPGMKDLILYDERGVSIGSAINMNRIIASPEIAKQYPVLVEACQRVAGFQLRNRATLIGNICNASPAGDTIGPCLLLGGVLKTYHFQGGRDIPLSNFFTGPGETILIPGEIVTSLTIPKPPDGLQGTYLKLGRNAISDLAIVGVTAIGHPDADTRSGFQIKLALASVAPTPIVVEEVNHILLETSINKQITMECGDIAMNFCSPIDDQRASAKYRKYMVRNLTINAIDKVWQALQV